MAPMVLAPTMVHLTGLHLHLHAYSHIAQAVPRLCRVQVVVGVRQPHHQPVTLMPLGVKGSHYTDLTCRAAQAGCHGVR